MASVLPAAETKNGQARFYHAELDGLRFLAFLAVFVLHLFPLVYPQRPPASPVVRESLAWIVSVPHAGEAGVDLFFVLSSFLITELLLREWDAHGRLDVWSFYARRALRIWPLYFGFLCLAPFIDRWLATGQGISLPYWLSFATFSSNWAISWNSARLNTVAIPLWTVAIEEQFYLAWPLLVVWLKPKRLGYLAASLIILAWSTRLYLGFQEASDLTISRNTFARLDAIGIGALICLGYRYFQWNFSSSFKRLLGIGGLALMIGSYRYLKATGESSLSMPLLLGCWAIGGGLLLMAAYDPRSENRSWLVHPWLVDLGRISYGLYVWHLAAIAIVFKLNLAKPATPLAALLALALTILLAKLSYHFLERPFLRWKDRLAKVPSREVEIAKASFSAENSMPKPPPFPLPSGTAKS